MSKYLNDADRQRKILEEIKGMAAFQGLNVSPSYLRQHIILKNAQPRYEFNFYKDSPSYPEVMLGRNDAFVITGFGVYLQAVRTNATQPKTRSNAVLQTYPNPTVFTGSSAANAALMVSGLEAVYGGFLEYKVGVRTYIEKLDLQHFRHVPQVQQTIAAANTVIINADAAGALHTEYKFSDGLYLPEPYVIVDGSATNSFAVNLPDTTNLVYQANGTTGTEDNELVIIPRGFLVSMGASKKGN